MSESTTDQSTEKVTMSKKDEEKRVREVFDLIVEEGIDSTTAAKYALKAYPKATKPFVESLSEGALTKVKGKVVEAA